jgi:hypothetical protein
MKAKATAWAFEKLYGQVGPVIIRDKGLAEPQDILSRRSGYLISDESINLSG